jgi:hypothetical protein
LEKTLRIQVSDGDSGAEHCCTATKRGRNNSHEQAGLSAGTVTDDNELASNLRHYVCWGLKRGEASEERVGGEKSVAGLECTQERAVSEMRKRRVVVWVVRRVVLRLEVDVVS